MIFSAQFFEDSVKMCRNQDDFRVVFDDSEVDKNYPDLYRWHWPNWPSPPPYDSHSLISIKNQTFRLVSLLYSVSSLSFINTDFCQLITETYFIFGYGVKSKGKSLEVKNDDHCKYNVNGTEGKILNIAHFRIFILLRTLLMYWFSSNISKSPISRSLVVSSQTFSL